MDFYKQIVNDIRKEYERNDQIFAMLVTGSVARKDEHVGNDVDILFVAKERIPPKEYRVHDILVETGGNTIGKMLQGLKTHPMYTYMYLDAKAIFDKGNYLQQLQEKAQQILDDYKPSEEEKKALRKWLVSVVDKVSVAKRNNDTEKVSFAVATNLWETIEGVYLINSMPTPASTSALRKIRSLKVLPDNFENIWNKMLFGTLEERTNNTVALIQFVISNIT